jgi:hypothetical protein
MSDSWNYRRSTFSGGPEMILSDGQPWQFPAPLADPVHASCMFGSEYQPLLQALSRPLDSNERQMLELALAMILLNANYDLSPEQTRKLLLFHPASLEHQQFQAALHDLACDHLEAHYRLSPPNAGRPHMKKAPGTPWYRRMAGLF